LLAGDREPLNAVRLLYVTDRRVDAYLVKALREAGHIVETTNEPADGLVMAAHGDYRAIVLDWWGRPAEGAAPFSAAAASLLVVIAAPDEAATAAVLAAGADALFARPASFGELEARLEALDRLVSRVRTSTPAVAIEMIAAEQAIRMNGRQLTLSGRDYAVMAYLVARTGEPVSLEQLQQHIWGDEAEPRPDLIRARISRLRRKLATAGLEARLRTLARHGYVLDAATTTPEPAAMKNS
jgi:two-component system, OmpR family, response regulator